MKASILGLVILIGSPACAAELDLDPNVIQNSPVLQRWQKQVPNVASKIRNDPSFRTRLRVGYASELFVGVEDLRLDRSNFTASATYRPSNWGADLHYYVRPLGSDVNVAPVLGYRQLETTEGANLGVRALFVLSRGGGADLTLTQSWVAPFSSEETGLTTLAIGYAITHNLRLATEIQRQQSSQHQDTRFGIGVEWMP